MALLEDAVEEGLGELGVVQHGAPFVEGLVGGEDDGLAAQAAAVDDAVEDVGCRVRVLQVADLVDLCRAPHNRRHRLRPAAAQRGRSPVHPPGRALRAAFRLHHEQPRLQRVGSHLPEPHDNGGRCGPPRTPLGDPRVRCPILPHETPRGRRALRSDRSPGMRARLGTVTGLTESVDIPRAAHRHLGRASGSPTSPLDSWVRPLVGRHLPTRPTGATTVIFFSGTRSGHRSKGLRLGAAVKSPKRLLHFAETTGRNSCRRPAEVVDVDQSTAESRSR